MLIHISVHISCSCFPYEKYMINTSSVAIFNLQGRCIFASGSPFKAVTLEDKTLYPGQGNNAYIFPGVALGVILCGIRHIPEIIFLRAAEVRSWVKVDNNQVIRGHSDFLNFE